MRTCSLLHTATTHHEPDLAGSTQQINELEILQHQHSQHLGTFQCEEQDVFSDVSVEAGKKIAESSKYQNTDGLRELDVVSSPFQVA